MKREYVNWVIGTALAIGTIGTVACKATTPNLSVSLTESRNSAPSSLTERVQGIHEEQTHAHENLLSVHEVFQQLTAPQATDIGRLSSDLKRHVKVCNRDADQIARQIRTFEAESVELIEGWKAQLESLGDAERKESKNALERTEDHVDKVLGSLRSVQKKLQPMLASLEDYMLFFEHNLNARAIAALDDTYRAFDEDVEELTEFLVHAQNEVSTVLTELDPASRPARLTTIVPDNDPPVDPDPIDPDPVVPDPVVPDPVDPDPVAPSADPPVGPDPVVPDPVLPSADPPVGPDPVLPDPVVPDPGNNPG